MSKKRTIEVTEDQILYFRARRGHLAGPGAANAAAAVALARGRVVATWTHKQQRGHLVVEVQPLSRWQTSKHAAQVRREAQAVAAHLDLDAADITIAK